MKQLTCEMCGSTDLLKQDGVFVCQTCGTKYSVEEAKKMMIEGTVRVDNSHMVDNWMRMGAAAASAGNHKEAYEYFTKVIEIDPENWRAIYEKGKAGAWQSTLGRLRTSEIYQGIQIALEIIKRSNMSEEELTQVKNEFAVALFNFNNAITDLMSENLLNLDDKYFDSHWDMMWNTRQRHITNVEQLEDALSLIADLDDDLSKSNVIEFKKRICEDLRAACKSIQYWNDYSQTSLGYLGFKPEDKKRFLDKFWDLVDEIREVEPDYLTEKWSYPDPFGPGLHNPDEIYRYWQKADAERKAHREKELQERRIREYWEAHSEEKKALESERNILQSELRQLQEQVTSYDYEIANWKKKRETDTPAQEEKKTVEKQMSVLRSEQSSLGIFKGKEKKALQTQIDELSSRLLSINESIDAERTEQTKMCNDKIGEIEQQTKPIKDKITAAEKRIGEITAELTKNR